MSIASEVGMEVVPARAVAFADAHNWVRLAVAVDIDPVDDAVRSPVVERLTDVWMSAKLSVGTSFEYPVLTTLNCGVAELPDLEPATDCTGALHLWISADEVSPAGERYRIGTVRSKCRWAGDFSSRHVIGRAVTPPLLKLKVYRDVVADVWAAEIVEAAGW